MGRILSNDRLSEDLFLLRAEACGGEEETAAVKAGQFYMLRGWDEYPLLSRPISVYDAQDGVLSFFYKAAGRGTRIISGLEKGAGIGLAGPYGQGFPVDAAGRCALVGGGVGIAPMHLLAKQLTEAPDIFLGFSGEPLLTDEFNALSPKVTIDIGGYITDTVDPAQYDVIMACGPEPMLRAMYRRVREACQDGRRPKVYVSMEKRMGCGIGICKVCTCQTQDGPRTVCKDGPVFDAEVLFGGEAAS